jgi:PAS domain S-box-containing protein
MCDNDKAREQLTEEIPSGEIVSVYRNETERKNVEDELIESERKYRDLIEGAPVGIFQSTFDGRVLSVNPAYARMYGYASAEEAALEIDNVAGRIYVEPERRKMLIDLALSTDGFVKAENQYRKKDGSLFWGQLYFRVIRDRDGEAKHLEGFVEDITQRKQAQEELRESEERYKAVFDNAAIGIDLVDRDGRYMQVNNALLSMLGYSDREFHQLRFTDITHPDDREISEQWLEKVMRREISAYRLEKRFIKKDGSTMWGDLSVSAIRNGNGEHVATLAVIADITDRKEAEEALKASHEALAAYSATLEAKVQERTSELEQSRADLKIYSESLEKANEALKLIIGGIEEQKKDVETRITQNLNLTVKPLLDQLKSQQLPDAAAFLLQSMEFNLSNMFSSFRLKVGHSLTPKEMRICEMIRSGLSSKQIAKVLNISPQTVLVHRKNVRKKLSLAKSRSNLASFLKANDGF